MPTITAYTAALLLIDASHAHDPTLTTTSPPLPSELYYAQRSTHYLTLRHPSASLILKTAVRAQHFRRWEVPRSSYPMTKAGYFAWRTYLKKRQAEMVEALCESCGYSGEEARAVGALMRKDGLAGRKNEREGEEDEAQILEDVACLVFLEVDFEGFEAGVEEEKMLGILRKTWGKMSARGREMVVEGMGRGEMEGRRAELVRKALGG